MVDTPNAFIQTRVQHKKDMSIIKSIVVIVDTLLEISPDIYDSYVNTYCKGLRQLVVQCQNSIYGTIMASLMYYQNFGKSLEMEEYEFNPYDLFITNTIIDNK